MTREFLENPSIPMQPRYLDVDGQPRKAMWGKMPGVDYAVLKHAIRMHLDDKHFQELWDYDHGLRRDTMWQAFHEYVAGDDLEQYSAKWAAHFLKCCLENLMMSLVDEAHSTILDCLEVRCEVFGPVTVRRSDLDQAWEFGQDELYELLLDRLSIADGTYPVDYTPAFLWPVETADAVADEA